MNSVHEWYYLNHSELCTDDGLVDAATIRTLCISHDGLQEQLKVFKMFLNTRTHFKNKKADGTPAPAGIGTIGGYRSAFGHYIWSQGLDVPQGVPHNWDAGLKDYVKGLKMKRRIGSKKVKVL